MNKGALCYISAHGGSTGPFEPHRWRDELDDTAIQTQHSKFELWRSEVENTFQSQRLPTIINLYKRPGKKPEYHSSRVEHASPDVTSFYHSVQHHFTSRDDIIISDFQSLCTDYLII